MEVVRVQGSPKLFIRLMNDLCVYVHEFGDDAEVELLQSRHMGNDIIVQCLSVHGTAAIGLGHRQIESELFQLGQPRQQRHHELVVIRRREIGDQRETFELRQWFLE